jgi:hypothetical protein
MAYSTHLIKLERVGAVVGGSHQEKQAGPDQAMADHLQHGATGAEGNEAADADQHKPHVADGAVGDLAFEIALGERGEGGIDDVHHAEHHQQRGELGMRGRQHLGVEVHQGIPTHLEQDAVQQHVHRSGGLTVSIGEPGGKGHDR